MLIALTAVNAQDQNQQSTEQSTEYRSTTENKQDSEYSWRDEDRESVSQQDLPPTLLETLKSDEYAGWENATIYRNKTSQDYMLVVQDGGDVKTFYFDSEGQAKKDHNSTGATGSSEYGTSGTGTTGSQDQSGTTGSESSSSSSSESGMTPSSTLPPEAGSDYNSGSSSSQSDMNTSGQSGSDDSQSGMSTSDQPGSGQSSTDQTSTDQTSSPRTSSDASSTTDSETGVSEPNPQSASPSYPMGTGSERAQGEPGTGTQGDSGMTGQQSETDDASGSTGSDASGSSSELQTENQSTSWNTEDRVIVVREEIPATLLVTLEDDRYEGWENSTVYRNNKTGDYMIEVRDGSSTKVYYFDAEGKEKSEK